MIPPNLSVDNNDASVNSPPAITLVSSDQQALPEPGPVNFVQGQGSLFLELLDSDLTDTLFVRVFVDYSITNPTAPRSTCTAAPSGEGKREVTCDLTALCLEGDDTPDHQLTMSVVVFDRQPLETADPPKFQAMPEGGLSTGRFYFLNCSAQ